MAKRITAKGREDILIRAFLSYPSVTEVAEKTGIPRSTIYKVIKTESFQQHFAEARKAAVDGAVNYLQGNLSVCAKVLMDIVGDKEVPPQVRINAANAVFQNARGLLGGNNVAVAGTVVKIIDSI